MNKSFESTSLFDFDLLKQLTAKQNSSSAVRLAIQLFTFAGLGVVVVTLDGQLTFSFLLTIPLAALHAFLFAPFHECIHGTAFESKWLNRLGAWSTGLFFGMSPSLYRDFHFAHHRYTHNPDKDPELIHLPGNGAKDATMPGKRILWISLCSGLGLLIFKIFVTGTVSILPTRFWGSYFSWIKETHRRKAAKESKWVTAFWVTILLLAIFAFPSMWRVLFAAAFSNLFLGLWLTTEHTGLPSHGSMFDKTRSIISSRIVRWWIWNMNFHAEHHAWPAVPWHRLPEIHERVEDHILQSHPGYLRVHWAQLSISKPGNRSSSRPR